MEKKMEKKVKFIITISEGNHRALKVEAAQEGTTMNALIVGVLLRYLRELEK
jgi:predicted HicB family RNase H-like nuclease